MQSEIFECLAAVAEKDRDLLYNAMYQSGITAFVDSFSSDDDATACRASVTFYCSNEAELTRLGTALRDALRVSGVQHTIDCKKIENRDWQESWKAGWKPQEVGRRFVIAPSWLPAARPGRLLIQIDPQNAFGTGTHETTRLCIEFLEERLAVHPGRTVLDVGCGTGVLCFAAKLLGAAEVRGVDLDDDIIGCARNNAALNAQAIEFSTTPLCDLQWQAQIVVANLLAHIIIENWAELRRLSTEELILSGVLVSELPTLTRALHLTDYETDYEVTQAGDWCAVLIRRR